MITAIIPARIGSKRMRYKNFLPFLGKPLLEWTIEAAIKSKYIDRIIVSTDYNEWEKEEYTYPSELVEIDNRPFDLSSGHVIIEEVIDYLRSKRRIEGTIILLQPTSPLRTTQHINEAIELFWAYKKNVISVNKYTYKPNGAIYIFNTKKIYFPPMSFYEMEPKESVDIDYDYEFRIAESIMVKRDNTA